MTKFIAHTISHVFFLALLALATFGAYDDVADALNFIHADDDDDDDDDDHLSSSRSSDTDDGEVPLTARPCHMHRLQADLRPTTSIINEFQIIIVFWIIGQFRYTHTHSRIYRIHRQFR